MLWSFYSICLFILISNTKIMKYLITCFILLFLPVLLNAQVNENSNKQLQDSIFNSIPFKDGQIIYEKVFFIDSINNKDQIYNAAKSALIKNTNYKYSKIDDDRSSGSISCNIAFQFIASAGIVPLTYDAKSLLSIDVKENRFRVRIVNNNASVMVMQQLYEYDIIERYQYEFERREKNKWKAKKSIVLNWHEKLSLILNAFGLIIKKGITNDDF